MSKDKKTWMVDATVTKGHKNGLYAIWLANKTTKTLSTPTKPTRKVTSRLVTRGLSVPWATRVSMFITYQMLRRLPERARC